MTVGKKLLSPKRILPIYLAKLYYQNEDKNNFVNTSLSVNNMKNEKLKVEKEKDLMNLSKLNDDEIIEIMKKDGDFDFL